MIISTCNFSKIVSLHKFINIEKCVYMYHSGYQHYTDIKIMLLLKFITLEKITRISTWGLQVCLKT